MPRRIDAAVFEEDTYLVLSADPAPKPTRHEPRKVLRQLDDTFPKQLGSVVISSGQTPVKLLAVIHDLDREPSLVEPSVGQVLIRILTEADERGCKVLALPILGRVHGSIDVDRFADALRSAIVQVRPRRVESLWLTLQTSAQRSELKSLKEWLAQEEQR
jgi:hypothetical protein